MDLREYIETPAGAPAMPERANVLRFLAWAQSVDDDQRAELARTLARAYLAGRLCSRLRDCANPGVFAHLDALIRDADLCLAALVQDPSTIVRRALAEALADAPLAPRYLVFALANDEPQIGAIVVRQSPLLTEADLAEFAIADDEDIQIAVAQRPRLPDGVAELLAESDRRRVAIALLINSETRLSQDAFRRIAEQFILDGEIRDALLARYDLPAPIRYDIVGAALRQTPLRSFDSASFRRRMRKVTNVVRERDLLRAAARLGPMELRSLIRHLRVKGDLNVCLLMRSLVSGIRSFFEAAAIELSGLPPSQAVALARDHQGAGFRAVYRRMGLPAHYLKSIRAALAALDETGAARSGLVSRRIISRVVESCESDAPALTHLMAFLRRLETESILDEGHDFAQRAAWYNRPSQKSEFELEAFIWGNAQLVEDDKDQPILLESYSEAFPLSTSLPYQQVA